MAQCPVCLRIQQHIKIRSVLTKQFPRFKSVKPHQKICLVQPMLPKKRWSSRKCRQIFILINLYISRIKHSLKLKLLIKTLCDIHNLIVRLRRRTDNHLRRLPATHKGRRMTINSQFILTLHNPVLNLPHRCQNRLTVLIRRQLSKAFCCRQFQVHTHPVHQISDLLQKPRIRSGNRLQMNVSLKTVFITKQPHRLKQQFHRVTRIPYYSRT